jgi:hypothetical protein
VSCASLQSSSCFVGSPGSADCLVTSGCFSRSPGRRTLGSWTWLGCPSFLLRFKKTPACCPILKLSSLSAYLEPWPQSSPPSGSQGLSSATGLDLRCHYPTHSSPLAAPTTSGDCPSCLNSAGLSARAHCSNSCPFGYPRSHCSFLVACYCGAI